MPHSCSYVSPPPVISPAPSGRFLSCVVGILGGGHLGLGSFIRAHVSPPLVPAPSGRHFMCGIGSVEHHSFDVVCPSSLPAPDPLSFSSALQLPRPASLPLFACSALLPPGSAWHPSCIVFVRPLCLGVGVSGPAFLPCAHHRHSRSGFSPYVSRLHSARVAIRICLCRARFRMLLWTFRPRWSPLLLPFLPALVSSRWLASGSVANRRMGCRVG